MAVKKGKAGKSVTRSTEVRPDGYVELLRDLKQRIRKAQVKAALAVNRELVLLYWGIGNDILARQKRDGWGAKVIDRLAKDLLDAFPSMTGLSPRNIKYMRAFAEAWPDRSIVQQLVAQLPWGHNVRLLDQVKRQEERVWYARQAIEHGWSRNVLVLQIESGLYRRAGKAVTNFEARLPPPDSDLAQQLIKDPYNFDFLTLAAGAHERELETGLLAHLQQSPHSTRCRIIGERRSRLWAMDTAVCCGFGWLYWGLPCKVATNRQAPTARLPPKKQPLQPPLSQTVQKSPRLGRTFQTR